MRVTLSYSFRDIWNGIRYTFSFKKLWTQLQGLILGTILYSIFSYLALMVSGVSFDVIWNYWKFIPIPLGEKLSTLGTILFVLGVILFVVVNYLYAVAVAKIAFEQLKGDEFYEVKEAIKFAKKKGWPVFTAPLSILFVIVFILVLGVVLGLFGKIKYVGELILLVFSLPAIIMCFFLVYLFLSFLLSWILSVAIVTSNESDTFDTLFEVFSTLNEQPFRFLLYEVYAMIVAFVTTFLFAWALGRSAWIMNSVLSQRWLMGLKFKQIVGVAKYYLPFSPAFFGFYPILKFLGVDGILNVTPYLPKVSFTVHLVGFFFGLGLYLMFFLVIAQFINAWNVETLLTYLVIAKKKDDLDLLEIGKEKESVENSAVQETKKEDGSSH